MRYRAPILLSVALLTVAVFSGSPGQPGTGASAPPVSPAPAGGSVIIAGGLSDTDLVAVSVAAAAAEPATVFLVNSVHEESPVRAFLERARPTRLVPVGIFRGYQGASERWGVDPSAARPAEADTRAFVRSLFPRATRVVVCPKAPAGELLQAACLAGTMGAPLVVLPDGDDPLRELWVLLKGGRVQEVLAVGSAAPLCRDAIPDVRITELKDAAAVAKTHRGELKKVWPIDCVVLANPADLRGMAALAPWVAVRHRAALLLTDADGKNASRLLSAAERDEDLAGAESVLIVAGPDAIAVDKRDNPAKGKDVQIDLEPGTPEADTPFTWATGRLFHADRAVVPLMLARPKLMDAATGARKALVASNPGGSLPLLETFSRNTARELANAGYQVTARFDKQVEGVELRKLLPEHDLFLWEGHHQTLVETYEMPKWTEPLPPAVVFLQSCLALNEEEAQPLLRRGALAVVGSPNRTYSGSGGAFSLAFLDAVAYDGQSVGGALRHAKNYLQCYALLKTKRLGDDAELGGANKRASWAFSLWGDPTLKLPRPDRPAAALPILKCEAKTNSITVTLPDERYPTVEVGPYRADLWPNGRLAGLLTRDKDDTRHMVPFAFAEVYLPKTPAGHVPRLSSRTPSSNWVFQWDGRRQVGYLLVLPRKADKNEVRFKVTYEPVGTVTY